MWSLLLSFFFQAEDGIRDLVRSRGLVDVYKRQGNDSDYFIHENLQEFLTQEKERYIKNHILSDLKSLSLIHI